MHLLFVTNSAYVPHVATTLASVFENNKDMSFCVHVLATDITSDDEFKLKNFIEFYNNEFDLRVVGQNNLDINIDLCGKWGIYPSLKLYASDFFPELDSMLYMDADMICLGSLHPIEEIDMRDYYIAMSPDEARSISHKHRLGLNANDFYGCAGLVWLNLKKWRKEGIRQKCINYFNAPENKDKILMGEQDVLNVVCNNHIYKLPIEYNMFSYYWLHHGRNIPEEYRETINMHKRNAVIIHYIDACKPWFEDCLFPHAKYYWLYQAFTPWKGKQYGYSTEYSGKMTWIKTYIKVFLHNIGIISFDYAYDK